MRLRLAARCRGERGSIPMALLALMVISAVITVVTATVVAGQRHTRFDDDFERALQAAEVGADRYVAILLQDQSVTSVDTGWVPTGGDAYRVAVTSDVTGRTISSTGRTQGAREVRRRLRVRLEQPRLFQHGLFGDVAVHITGTSRRLTSYSSTTGAYSGDDPPDNKATVASNGEVHASGSTNGGTIVYTGEERFDVSSDAAVAFITNSFSACEEAGRMESWAPLEGAVTISPSTWRPDPWHDEQNFYCVENLDFANNADLQLINASSTNPVKIFVRNRVSFGRNVSVNCATGCLPGSDAPNAGALQIYTTTSTQVSFGKDVKLAAALYAPRAQCAGGTHVNVWGSMVCRVAGEFTGHFRLYYDETLQTVLGSTFTRWSEEPGA